MRKRWAALTAGVRALADSPVLVKELRTLLRGWRAPALMAASAGLGALACVVLLFVFWPARTPIAQAAAIYPQVGRQVFVGLVMLEGAVCTLALPILTAGAFAGERQRGLLDSLFLTRLTNTDIVLGKLLAALAFMMLLLVCNLPVLAIVAVLGGVTPGDLLWALLLLLHAALVQGALGLYLSLRAPNTVTAAGLTFVLFGVGLALCSVLLTGAYLHLEVFWIVVAGFVLSVGLAASAGTGRVLSYWRVFGLTWGSMLLLVLLGVLGGCLARVSPVTVFTLAHPSMLFYMLLMVDSDNLPRLILLTLALCTLEAWAAHALYRATLDTLNTARPLVWSREMRTSWRHRSRR